MRRRWRSSSRCSGIAFVTAKTESRFSTRTIRSANTDSILLVEDLIVVELKAIRAFEDIHFAIGRSYLKATGLRTVSC